MEKSSKGYTLVEVMMALTVLAIGAAGIFSLQTVAVGGNRDANDLTAATNLARGWVDTLKVDAERWTNGEPVPVGNLANTKMIQPLYAAGAANWTNLNTPPYQLVIGPQRADGGPAANGRFCAQARVRQPTPIGAGAGITVHALELAVRVWWYKAEGGAPNCASPVVSTDLAGYRWVYITTLLVPNRLN